MDKTKKDLISVAIEDTLIKTGSIPLLDEVNSRLFKKFNSSIGECYDHPEYLKQVLDDMFGNGHHVIVKSIVKKLTAFNYDNTVLQFIEKVSY